jgi:hypothetical protein
MLQLTLANKAFSSKYYVLYKSYLITGLDRPLGLPGVEALKISRQLAHTGNKVVSPVHRPPLPPGDPLVLIGPQCGREVKQMKKSR